MENEHGCTSKIDHERRTTINCNIIDDDNNDITMETLLSLKDPQINTDSKDLDAAVVWERMSNGYRIVDLPSNKIYEALKLIRNRFFNSEPMCCSTGLSKDALSTRTYLQIILKKISDETSCCALQEGTGRLVGVAVASVNMKADQARTECRTRMNQGEAIFKVMTLKSCLFAKARLYERLNIDKYFRLHVLCVEPEHEGRGIGTALVRSCIARTREMRIPACIGAFSSGASQTIGDRLEFEKLAEISYESFEMPYDFDESFRDPGQGNYSVACMALSVAALTPPPTPALPTFQKRPKLIGKGSKK